jgi:AraC-like DNA-binding protein/quercetin dioxygenase-like cupin family protein
MSRDGQAEQHPVSALPLAGGSVLLGEFDLPAGTWFPWHLHDHHQLVWASQGVVVVNINAQHWVLPPARALWLPAGTAHRTGASGNAVLRGIYADPVRCPVTWTSPHMVKVGPLLSDLLEHLTRTELTGDQRQRAEAVVFDLLEPAPVAPIGAVMPTDPRAHMVAQALMDDLTDRRDLAAFGRMAGTSARTLARLWIAETRLTFGQWRTQVRLRAALPFLARGLPLDGVAHRVGYCSASAFAAAFRRAVGVPPGEYFTGVGPKP